MGDDYDDDDGVLYILIWIIFNVMANIANETQFFFFLDLNFTKNCVHSLYVERENH